MAIVQVSQITNRLGLQEDLPQLAGGELGWSTDTRQLYIGNGTLTEGAPVIGNTEILTEFSDILNLGSVYTYKGVAGGYTVQTGPTPGTPVVQSLQTWMDQWASVKDFGAAGDGITDDTAAINRALNQLYCQPSQRNTSTRRSLFFPAGVYLVTNTINIPSFATLYGEGPNNSIIQMAPTGIGTYVAQTADLGQRTGPNNSGSTNITITNMAFQSRIDTGGNVFLIQSARDCEFNGVSFIGHGTQSNLTTTALNSTGVSFASTAALITTDILFDGCRFTGTVYGISTSAATRGIIVTNSSFNTLYQGINLSGTAGVVVSAGSFVRGVTYSIVSLGTTDWNAVAGTTGVSYNVGYVFTATSAGSGTGTAQSVNLNSGPSGTRITNNIFDIIYAEGILISTSLNATGYNIFYNVANSFNGVISPTNPIILFSAQDNVSIGDMFQRSAAYSVTYPQVSHTSNNIVTTNGGQISLGTLTVQSGNQALLDDAKPIATTIFTLDTNVATSFSIEYSITRYDGYRYGTFMVSSLATLLFQNITSYTDDFNENTDLGVNLSAYQDPANPRYILIQYTTGAPLTGHGAIMNYSIRHF